MDLFSSEKIKNILPFDGVTNYHGIVLNNEQCNFYYNELMQKIKWKNDEAIIFGKRIITKRKVAWYGESEYSYTYSKVTKKANIWIPELLELKAIVEKESNENYNSCLLNYIIQEMRAWLIIQMEKNDEKRCAIASLSLELSVNFPLNIKRINKE